MEYNESRNRYEAVSTEPLRTHYIGLEYDLSDAHRVLLGTNYHQIHKYRLADTVDSAVPELHLDGGGGGGHYNDMSLLGGHPAFSLLLNHSLPAWIWVPLLNHTLRVLVERVLLFGNISLFLWTIYQMTKYTSIIRAVYELVVFPLFEYISQPLLRKWYYVLNLLRFNVVVQLWSSLFAAFYNFIPIDALYRALSFVDQHIVQQMLSLLLMFYRLVVGVGSVLWPCLDVVARCCARSLSLLVLELDCTLCVCCKRLSQCCDGRCWSGLQLLWQCLMRCCRLCQRSQSLTDHSTQILKAGVRIKDTAAEVDGAAAWRACTAVREVWRYSKALIDVFWIGIGKPVKHCYDFFRYVRSEVGTVVAICIKKCCRKSKEKVKIAGQRVLEEAVMKMRRPSLETEGPQTAPTDGHGGDEEVDLVANTKGQKAIKEAVSTEGLRRRGGGRSAGTQPMSENGQSGNGERKRNEEEHKSPMYSAVRGIPYFKDQAI